ncbi:DNA starvation/stationary phase protection protein [Ursidibacter maritimus]|uniref:DNA starvation/stationary phase protection protein n=1 Tax=Ursidibacter maritimus TaxID=1331689 RepID=A0A949WGX6_9PAST|nr:Dps family protein [Ursidibacter maritimus]KAE9540583.1 DNA starvation/stationary phase protection protein [Ursidibacter maritimus]MBV6524410.1 DNA starvation/stationary phase protection protein [Ursidibacter maritimus]MBV6526585.1 DNA starvation/stationary phase protection protein [Ursidibacter maritimus]MBV6528534.1 DNA starvation/stationary phase protection protein [Ursidibacter maritimus]MBV6530017.1 DNA starvation/stationary phase protection protein [Ursidibacter maritimus]
MKNSIGLNTVSSEKLAAELNKLLASYQVFYTNVRGYHWNIKGVSFFELHAKFEEIYNDLVVKVDEIAERILTLGHVPANAFSQYLQASLIKEHIGISSAQECLTGTVEGLKTLLKQQREILAFANELDDEGTASQMSDYIKEQEKLVWMFSAAATCGVCQQ